MATESIHWLGLLLWVIPSLADVHITNKMKASILPKT